jgi:hypothetical protein
MAVLHKYYPFMKRGAILTRAESVVKMDAYSQLFLLFCVVISKLKRGFLRQLADRGPE